MLVAESLTRDAAACPSISEPLERPLVEAGSTKQLIDHGFSSLHHDACRRQHHDRHQQPPWRERVAEERCGRERKQPEEADHAAVPEPDVRLFLTLEFRETS